MQRVLETVRSPNLRRVMVLVMQERRNVVAREAFVSGSSTVEPSVPRIVTVLVGDGEKNIAVYRESSQIQSGFGSRDFCARMSGKRRKNLGQLCGSKLVRCRDRRKNIS